jgi:hypothetical protein
MQKARRGELWIIDLGLAQKTRPCLILSISLHESLTYFLHHSYKCLPRVCVYWPHMKAQRLYSYGIAISLATMVGSAPAQPLVVHEWGTFTSLQDEAGRTLGGINTDDEPVPAFCHDVAWSLVARPSELPPVADKGASRCHPDVTMRLETPVLYFHPPPGAPTPLTASVNVAFRGGWLTQFYPAAETAGLSSSDALNENSTGSLTWNDLQIGITAKGPETGERVWTAPRAVQSASVSATNGESEQFLFYRGVGHVACPLQVTRTADLKTLECRSQVETALSSCPPMPVQHLWLASFRADGACAFRALPPIALNAKSAIEKQPAAFSTPAGFGPSEYSAANLDRLRWDMRSALQEEGLFPDEADALLNTWELSYFKSAGLRLFFMVPRAWTDWYLPLSVSVPCEVKRAMVGRLELVTPEQRALLQKLAQAAVPTTAWAHFDMTGQKAVVRGAMPAVYRDLGRFRHALLLDEYQARPTPSLDAFIRLNGLQGRRG